MLLAVGMSSAAQERVNLGLIPTPQIVETGKWKKDSVDTRRMKVQEVEVDAYVTERYPWKQVQANVEQAYILTIAPKGVTIEYYEAEGLANARLTLAQLHSIYGDVLPCVRIVDWPAYRYRGWMDDISRGPVPHAKYREKQWNRLHALKYNFCNYYTEHTLYQPEFPDLAPAYAAECRPHSDEVINLQLFAHAEKTLRIPFYQNMMDSRTNFDPSVEATYDFLRQRIAAAYQRIPNSPFFIINCDETEQLGTGRAKKLVDSKGADQVYVDFINRCYQLVNDEFRKLNFEKADAKEMPPCRRGRLRTTPRIAMWGDIVAKNPEMMKQLPKDMIYIMWAYEPIDSFKHLIKPFKEQGNPFWVAASTGHSATMTSTPQRYIKNIANLFRDGYRDGAEGAMLTCWDDNGEALFDNSWHAQYWAAEMAWNPIKTDDPEELRQREAQFNENFERLFYSLTPIPSPSGEGCKYPLTQQLYDVGALMYNPAVGDWYTSAALMEPLLNFNPDNTSEAAVYSRVAKVLKAMDTITVTYQNPHAAYALERIRATVKKTMLRLFIYKLLKGDKQEGVDMESTIRDNADSYFQDLSNLKRFYINLWDHENGDYERYIVMNRYDDLAREVLELDRHVFMEVGCDAILSHPMVALRTLFNDRPIYYTLDGSTPNESSTRYEKPFPLERSATIKAIAYNEYGEGVVTEQYLLSHLGMGAKMKLKTQYSTYKSIYSGGGENALINGQLGSNTTYADGHWQGYWGDSIDATIDFGKPTEIHEVSMRFMQNTFDWILAPTAIRVYCSEDGEKWYTFGNEEYDMDPRETGMRLKQYVVKAGDWWNRNAPDHSSVRMSIAFNARYVRVVVPNPGPLPEWHPAPGQPSYLFTDEIVIH